MTCDFTDVVSSIIGVGADLYICAWQFSRNANNSLINIEGKTNTHTSLLAIRGTYNRIFYLQQVSREDEMDVACYLKHNSRK